VARISTLEELLGLPDAEQVTEVITVPDLGTVRIRALSRKEHREMTDDCGASDKWDGERWEILLLQHSVVEPQLTYDQAAKMRLKASGPVGDLIGACARLSGLTDRGQISKEAVDEAEATFQQEPDSVQDV
jgi:hypothetical protein